MLLGASGITYQGIEQALTGVIGAAVSRAGRPMCYRLTLKHYDATGTCLAQVWRRPRVSAMEP